MGTVIIVFSGARAGGSAFVLAAGAEQVVGADEDVADLAALRGADDAVELHHVDEARGARMTKD